MIKIDYMQIAEDLQRDPKTIRSWFRREPKKAHLISEENKQLLSNYTGIPRHILFENGSGLCPEDVVKEMLNEAILNLPESHIV